MAIPAIWTLPGSHLWEVFLPGWSPSRQKWGSAPREERWTRVQARWTRPSWRKAPPPSSSHPSCRCPLSLRRHHGRNFGSLLCLYSYLISAAEGFVGDMLGFKPCTVNFCKQSHPWLWLRSAHNQNAVQRSLFSVEPFRNLSLHTSRGPLASSEPKVRV